MYETNKYEEALRLYNTQLNDKQISEKVALLLKEKVEENNNYSMDELKHISDEK